MIKYFEFEKDVEKIDKDILLINSSDEQNLAKIKSLNIDRQKKLKKIYSSLSPWQKVQVARHSLRPHTYDYIKNIFEDYIPLHGDKNYADDSAIIGGFAKINNISVMVIGTEKGNSMESGI